MGVEYAFSCTIMFSPRSRQGLPSWRAASVRATVSPALANGSGAACTTSGHWFVPLALARRVGAVVSLYAILPALSPAAPCIGHPARDFQTTIFSFCLPTEAIKSAPQSGQTVPSTLMPQVGQRSRTLVSAPWAVYSASAASRLIFAWLK